MKIKITIFSLLLLSFVALYNTDVHAESYNSSHSYGICYSWTGSLGYRIFIAEQGQYTFDLYESSSYRIRPDMLCFSAIYNSPEDALYWFNNTFLTNPNYNFATISLQTIYTPFTFIELVNHGTTYSWNQTNNNYYTSWDDYQDVVNPPPPDPTWWDNVGEYWNGFLDTFEWWLQGGYYTEFWDWMFNTEPESTELVDPNLNIMTMAPTPTPIPYSINVVPIKDPSTGDIISYEYNYHYYDDNGNPITATAPPPQPSGVGGSGIPSSNNGTDDPFSIPSGSFIDINLSTGEGSTISSLVALGEGLDIVNTVSADYDDSISSVSDSFVVLPDKWFLLLGVGAGIILIAGFIGRLLG